MAYIPLKCDWSFDKEMKKIIFLHYKLNKFYFFNSNVVLSEIGSFWKSVIFGIYFIARCMLYVLAFGVINVYLSHEKIDISHFLVSQIVLLVVSIFILSKQATVSNKRIRNLDFFLGKYFTLSEQLSNLKKIGTYYLISMLGVEIMVDSNILFYYRNSANYLIVITFLFSFISLGYVFWKNITISKEKYQERAKYPWPLQYIFVSVIGIIFINLFQRRRVTLRINSKKGISILMMILFSLIAYIIIDFLKSYIVYKSKSFQRQKRYKLFRGTAKDFIEKYIRGAAIWLIGPAVVLRIIHIGGLSKAIILAILVSFLLTPNLCSRSMLNYAKLIGKHMNFFLFRYVLNFSPLLICLQIALCLFSGIGIKYMIFSVLITIFLLFIRLIFGIVIIQSGHSDNKKMDYYSFVVITTLLIAAICAYYWR